MALLRAQLLGRRWGLGLERASGWELGTEFLSHLWSFTRDLRCARQSLCKEGVVLESELPAGMWAQLTPAAWLWSRDGELG